MWGIRKKASSAFSVERTPRTDSRLAKVEKGRD